VDGSVPNPSQVVILAEDQRHSSFVRSYLKKRGFLNHQITVEPLPAGRGCGEQWVRERYGKSVGACRWRSARAQTALVVIVDADIGSVERRTRQLSDGLVQDDIMRRSDEERIAHLIPKRNIETWILCLSGNQVDEDSDYRAEKIDGKIVSAAAVFFDWSRRNAQVPPRCVPSLRLAIPEIRRLDD
jgi:hypothetical protein